MKGDRGSSRADTLVKVTLVFFISLLSFSVGTFVGKQVSDSEHRKIALEGEYKGHGGREIASESTESEPTEAADESDKISEKEVASLTEEFVTKDAESGATEDHDGYKTYARKGEGRDVTAEKSAQEHAANEHAANEHAAKEHGGKDEHPAVASTETHAGPEKVAESAHKSGNRAGDASHKLAEKVAEGHPLSEGEAEKPKPKSELPPIESVTAGKYTVQVASYAEEKDAKARAADLKAKGFQSFYLAATVNGKVWYRVLVGTFPNVKSADEYRAKLVKDGATKSAIVQKIVQ